MVEYSQVRVAVVVCCGEALALDALTHDALHACRVAPDELMLIDAPARAARLMERAQAGLDVLDAGALVLDVSAGWSAWQLTGDAAPAAFARLSSIPLASGFLQGAVAGVPARVLVPDDGGIVILTASTLRHHIGRRIRESCADLHAAEVAPRALAESARS